MIVRQRGPVTPVERVQAGIRARLLNMQGGEALPPLRDLATEYQTSVTTVRKAMVRLTEEGLVTTIPGWGTFKAEP